MGKKILLALLFLMKVGYGGLWNEDLGEALNEAYKTDKIVGLYFSESDYCPWCKKFDKEILNDEKFIGSISSCLIMVLVDFPKYKKIEQHKIQRNEALKNKYQITAFPTLVLLDSKANVITQMGYLPVSPAKYAENIKKIINEYKELSSFNFEEISTKDLKSIYEKAKKLGYDFLQKKCLEKGVKCQDNYFFLEKYSILLKQNRFDQAIRLKKKMQYLDPNNHKKTHLKLALIDFENLSEKKDLSPEKAIAPLVEYINKFGKKDKEYWRLEMMMSQYLSSRGKIKLALSHARECYKAAPSIIKKDLAKTIWYLKNKIKEEPLVKKSD